MSLGYMKRGYIVQTFIGNIDVCSKARGIGPGGSVKKRSDTRQS